MVVSFAFLFFLFRIVFLFSFTQTVIFSCFCNSDS
ncbi:unnamed protein product [Arabidopsis halleri]